MKFLSILIALFSFTLSYSASAEEKSCAAELGAVEPIEHRSITPNV